jgi:hypothetical protein
MPRGEALRLGPFVGGLNTGSDPTAVADSELVVCTNFELDLDGSIVQRPPIYEVAHVGAYTHNTVIGSAIISGVSYIIVNNSNGVYAFDGVTWTLILAGLTSYTALQYRNLVYIVATEASVQNGGYWKPGVGFTAIATMPRGESAIFSKARMFIVPGSKATVNPSRLQFSDPVVADALTWPAINIIDISPGDGQNLIDILIYNDNILLFKQDSTYVLAYDLQPTDAILRNISTTIGATTRFCVQLYENSVFVYHEGKVYEIVNYDFSQLNIKVPFEFDGATPVGTTRSDEVFLSKFGDRLLVRYYNKLYVFGLKTRVWSLWESANDILHNFGPLVAFPSNPTQSINTKYYGGSCITQLPSMLVITDGYDAVTKEGTLGGLVTIFSTLQTKNYDLADSHHFKKMMWWGADILTNQDIVGQAEPIVTSFQVTWADLVTKTWASISGNTWAAPLLTPAVVETDITILTSVSRKFVKFRKAMRFRQIHYTVTLKGDGSTATGPCRLFSMTAIIGSKETVSKQVS